MNPAFQTTLLKATLLTAALLASACGGAADDPVLRFSAIPDQNTTELAEKFDRVADWLQGELGVPVEFVPTSDYTASVEAFKNGDVQLAWFGGLTGVRARAAVEGARAIAQGRVDPEYRSYFVANGRLGLSLSDVFPEELEGRTFTFGSESSTSGRLMPEVFLRRETGVAPADFFAGEEMNFSGAHDKTALVVEEGTFDAGVLSYKHYDEMVASGKLDPTRCVKVWETPPYPDYNWTAHPVLDETFGEGFLDRLQETLVGLEDPELLAAVQRPEGMIPAENEDFAPLEELARELGLLR